MTRETHKRLHPGHYPSDQTLREIQSMQSIASRPGFFSAILGICLLHGAQSLARCDENEPAKGLPFPVADAEIHRYTAYRTTLAPNIDGRLDEDCWKCAVRSPRFVDMVTGRPVVHDTQAAVRWDDTFLYVGFWVEEPFVEGHYTNRDAAIYRENDIEVFIAGKDAYYEFEMNSLGTIYEIFFIWESAFAQGGYEQDPGLSLTNPRTARFHGLRFSPHPRGPRVACLDWDFPNAQHAVFVDGSLNKNDDRDRGWTAELAFPWSGMKWLAVGDGRSLPPRPADVWRMDFSRFNTYRESMHPEDDKWGDSGGWVWSKHGVRDSHVPEVFPYITFSAETAPTQTTPCEKEPATSDTSK